MKIKNKNSETDIFSRLPDGGKCCECKIHNQTYTGETDYDQRIPVTRCGWWYTANKEFRLFK